VKYFVLILLLSCSLYAGSAWLANGVYYIASDSFIADRHHGSTCLVDYPNRTWRLLLTSTGLRSYQIFDQGSSNWYTSISQSPSRVPSVSFFIYSFNSVFSSSDQIYTDLFLSYDFNDINPVLSTTCDYPKFGSIYVPGFVIYDILEGVEVSDPNEASLLLSQVVWLSKARSISSGLILGLLLYVVFLKSRNAVSFW